MHHKVDKRSKSGIKLAQVQKLWPVPEHYAKNSSLYLYPCACGVYAKESPVVDRYGHSEKCSLYHVAESMGADFTGVTAVWVGDTETGEYRGIFVTYGTFVRSEDTIYYPVVARKDTFIDVDFASCVSLAISQADDVQTYTPAQIKNLNKIYHASSRTLGAYAESDVIRRAKTVNGALYVSLATILNRWYPATLRKI
jgi:hypothetical protein